PGSSTITSTCRPGGTWAAPRTARWSASTDTTRAVISHAAPCAVLVGCVLARPEPSAGPVGCAQRSAGAPGTLAPFSGGEGGEKGTQLGEKRGEKHFSPFLPFLLSPFVPAPGPVGRPLKQPTRSPPSRSRPGATDPRAGARCAPSGTAGAPDRLPEERRTAG